MLTDSAFRGGNARGKEGGKKRQFLLLRKTHREWGRRDKDMGKIPKGSVVCPPERGSSVKPQRQP